MSLYARSSIANTETERTFDGDAVGRSVGAGALLGIRVGTLVPSAVTEPTAGALEGAREGARVGALVGALEGVREGALVGAREGALEGAREGALEGAREGALEGARVGALEGARRSECFTCTISVAGTKGADWSARSVSLWSTFSSRFAPRIPALETVVARTRRRMRPSRVVAAPQRSVIMAMACIVVVCMH